MYNIVSYWQVNKSTGIRVTYFTRLNLLIVFNSSVGFYSVYGNRMEG